MSDEDPVMPWAPVVWSPDDTMAYLSVNPLPSDFVWPHRDGGDRPVVPSHSTLKGGYGKWLRETPYFQGLFELIHDLLVRADPLPDAEGLARTLNEVRRLRGEQKELFPDLR